jgi:prephenate dehydrogenase
MADFGPNPPVHLRKLTIVGVGLLGGSLGLAVRERRLAGQVCGVVRRPEAVAECERLGVVDTATANLALGVRDADLVVLCCPLGQMEGLLRQMLPFLSPDAIVTDVGSVKGSVLRQLEPLALSVGARFIGSHPMAGSEKTGPGAARADLFQGSVCVLTPTAQSNSEALRLVGELWMAVGSRLISLSPTQHDDLVSRSSHLPHVVAAALANYVLSPVHPPEQAVLCASGFRDTTRVAGGAPELWRDIALANKHHLSRVLGVYLEDLAEFRHALDSGDTAGVEEFFVQAWRRREAWGRQSNPVGARTDNGKVSE